MSRTFTRFRILRLIGSPARFASDRRGATAVEFALLALPMLFLIFCILEMAIIYMISTTLANATARAARDIRLGSVQANGTTVGNFKTEVCSGLAWLGPQCAANLEVDVRTYAAFTNANIPDPISGGVFNTGALSFNPGQAGEIVLVRTFYKWPLVTPFLAGSLERLNGGVAVVNGAAMFRNEPYSS